MDTHRLEREIALFQQWREELVTAIEAYQGWLEQTGNADMQQSLRIYDLIESLKHDHIVLAFVAEFSRGKTELINALFFSDFKQRLLPSDAGRTTMCPTEIFHDAGESPYIRLLPIETRYKDDTVAALKRKPIEWVKTELDLQSHRRMMEAMESLTQTKVVSKVEARTLGLWDDNDPALADMVRQDGRVEIPAWRHAMINYPHPLLQSGLVILDTPGLNALGSEPELTLSMIPKAHAALYLLSTDTGVTKSDLEVWQKHIENCVAHRVAVLNKIDILWDDLKPWDKIQATVLRQRQSTANLLKLPIANVLAVSAQKGLIAKIKEDDALLEKSGLPGLEALLGNEIVPTKQAILRKAVANELGGMVKSSHKAVHGQMSATAHEMQELGSLSGKNKEVVKGLLNKLYKDKVAYEQTVESFNSTRRVVSQHGKGLLAVLNPERFDEALMDSRTALEGSWTTSGLSRGMQKLADLTLAQFDKVIKQSAQIKGLVDAAYRKFHEEHGFEKVSADILDLSVHRAALANLQQSTAEFCKDPINLMTEKRFLIKRFFLSLGGELRGIYERSHADCEGWCKNVLGPLILHVHEYKAQIERRLENIKKIHDNIDTLEERVKELVDLRSALDGQAKVLDDIYARLFPAEAVVESALVEPRRALHA